MNTQSVASPLARTCFPERTLNLLVEAGWSEGRRWDANRIQPFLDCSHRSLPPSAIKILTEFGGLVIGSVGRTITFGYLDERLRTPFDLLGALLGEPLFPIGFTNIFEDDGLGVLTDSVGRLYVDGATGYDPPRDYRLDLISPDIDTFFGMLFSGDRISELQSWYYSASDLT